MKGLVWGFTFEDGCKKLNEIKENYLRYHYTVTQEIKTKTTYSVTFDNGDCWRAVRASESSRGNKANLSYVDIRIQDQNILNMIHHCTIAGPWNAIKFYGMA